MTDTKTGTMAEDFLREALEGYRYAGVWKDDRNGSTIKKYIAPNGAPVLIEHFFRAGGFEVYGALENTNDVAETLEALRLYGSPDGQ